MAIFELMAPVIEFFGFATLIYLFITGAVNYENAVIMFLAIYIFCILLSIVVISYDYTTGGSYKNVKSYAWIMLAAIAEPFLYHPMVVFFSLKGYWNYISGKKAVWGEMTRKGFINKTEKTKK